MERQTEKKAEESIPCFNILGIFVVVMLIGLLLKDWNSFEKCYLTIQYWAMLEYITMLFYLIITLSNDNLLLTPLSIIIFVCVKIPVTLYGAYIQH